MQEEARRATVVADTRAAMEALEAKRQAEKDRLAEEAAEKLRREAFDPFASDSEKSFTLAEGNEEEEEEVAEGGNEEEKSEAAQPDAAAVVEEEEEKEEEEEEEDDRDSIDRLSLSTFDSNDVSDGDSDESSTVMSDAADCPVQYLRVHTKTKKMSGVEFKCTIMLSGRVSNLWTAPNEYFNTEGQSNEEALYPLDVELRFKDTFTKQTHELSYSGREMLGWFSMVPDAPKIQLESTYRRDRFGEYVFCPIVLASILFSFVMSLSLSYPSVTACSHSLT
jgi:hypothetical protein